MVAECRGSCFNCAFIDRCGVTRREGLFVSVCVCGGGGLSSWADTSLGSVGHRSREEEGEGRIATAGWGHAESLRGTPKRAASAF